MQINPLGLVWSLRIHTDIGLHQNNRMANSCNVIFHGRLSITLYPISNNSPLNGDNTRIWLLLDPSVNAHIPIALQIPQSAS
mmetsp:Transcript_31335/g.40535  ORF Transcript_31335/g.40535 Transcript_31335/m.40535 type:complete len:82 (+) Transcript_31335:57-302(+)